MKLSFVIPAHNEERHIAACLDAIMRELAAAKHDRETEVIVVNNASTDRTRAIALRYPGVRVVDEPKKGLVRARARGLKESTGELVANIDADVTIPSGWLEAVFHEFERDPKLVCLSGPLVYHDLSRFIRSCVILFYALGVALSAIARILTGRGAIVQGGNFIFKRAAFAAAGGYDMSFTFYGEDTLVARKLVPFGRVKFSFRLPVYSSGRRLAHEGVLIMAGRYAVNYFWVTLTGKPFHRSSVDIRPHASP